MRKHEICSYIIRQLWNAHTSISKGSFMINTALLIQFRIYSSNEFMVY